MRRGRFTLGRRRDAVGRSAASAWLARVGVRLGTFGPARLAVLTTVPTF